VKLTVDEDQLSELAEDRSKLWEQVGAASFLSDEEKRDMLGFGARGVGPTPSPSPEGEGK
jgi:phage portal protein BeeE